jgi:hypothetical protein
VITDGLDILDLSFKLANEMEPTALFMEAVFVAALTVHLGFTAWVDAQATGLDARTNVLLPATVRGAVLDPDVRVRSGSTSDWHPCANHAVPGVLGRCSLSAFMNPGWQMQSKPICQAPRESSHGARNRRLWPAANDKNCVPKQQRFGSSGTTKLPPLESN